MYRPGAVPLAFGSTAAPRGTIACRRLISGIVMPRRRKRWRIASLIARSSDSGQLERRRHHVARDVIVGGPEAADEDDQIRAAERAAENGGQVVGAIADDGLGAQRDAERTQPIGNRERVGVEPVRRRASPNRRQ